ncbi:hypothetical protein BDZ91DRAFT_853538 [Kalaharituber pfeilii]|nr:hypothetical protein BDZ91DRAFT_853538 [Kalaharituber pfeilii]
MAPPPAVLPPPIAPFPPASVRSTLSPPDWASFLATYITILNLHLSLPPPQFSAHSHSDPSLYKFLASYLSSVSESGSAEDDASKQLKHTVYRVLHRFYDGVGDANPPPQELTQGQFLLSFAAAYPKSTAVRTLFEMLWTNYSSSLEASFTKLKTAHVLPLLSPGKSKAGNQTDRAPQLQSLLHNLAVLFLVSPRTSNLFIAGSDFLDSLIELYSTTTNPALRKPILRCIQVAFTVLVDPHTSTNNDTLTAPAIKPNFTLLFDHLYSLLSHKSGSAEHSFLTSLISETTLLHRLRSIHPEQDDTTSRLNSLISRLEKYTPRGDGRVRRPLHIARRRKEKGKGKASDTNGAAAALQEETMGQYVLQVKEVFPELHDSWVRSKLEEYGGDVEAVVRGIIEGTLQEHPADVSSPPPKPRKLSSTTPAAARPLPQRRNIYDNDALDTLSPHALASLHIGKKAPTLTADALLNESTHDPSAKAAILAALATFDEDEDERDDTYDVADVGGVVDTISTETSLPGSIPAPGSTAPPSTQQQGPERILWNLWSTSTPSDRVAFFARDSETRRGPQRAQLKRDTGWSDEMIEGWGVMMERDIVGRRQRDLERKGMRKRTRELTEMGREEERKGEDGEGGEEEEEGVVGEGEEEGWRQWGWRGHAKGQTEKGAE